VWHQPQFDWEAKRLLFWAAAAPILGAVGAGVQAIGGIAGGQAQAAEANYKAQVAQNNAIIAQQNANYATAAGTTQTFNVGQQEREKAGKITTGLAASGLDVNTGSAARVRASQAEISQEAEEQTTANAALTAYGYRTQATGYQAESTLEKQAAKEAVPAAILGAGGTLLSNAGNIGFKFWGLQNNPTPTSAGT
jgi:hypothetical protein